jgi:phenylpropionate dioxygenase-like ring-hydroxylating dioxygenase large terminal subunit
MKTLIPVDAYRDQRVFDGELPIFFRNCWQFAGFARHVANDKDYIVAGIGGKSVIVQNFEGSLRAFLNVCTHRFSAIRHECKGNGILQCPYHGWVFDKSGVPAGIANVREFDCITDDRRRELTLRRWDVEYCGELLFIREGEANGTSLRTFLGGAWEIVETIGSSLGEELDCNKMIVAANWKVAVENTLENYHVRSIHPESFARLSAHTSAFAYNHPHSGWAADIDPAMQKKLRKITSQLGLSSPFDAYFHQLVFPSLTLATTTGLTFSIQTFNPLTPSTTEFTSYVFAARHNGPEPLRQLLLQACGPAVEFNRKVFEEDRVICGIAQQGIQQAPNGIVGELSNEEQRVVSFQKAWCELMSSPVMPIGPQ